MPKVTNYDILTFFYCVLAGVALSVLSDILRALRKHLKTKSVFAFITDLCFFIIAALATFFMQFVYSNGTVRFYILFGELCGFAAARVVVSPFNNRLFALINRIIRMIIKPIRTVLQSIYKRITPLFKKTVKNMLISSKNILKTISGLVYNVLSKLRHKTKADKRKSKPKAVRSNAEKKKAH